MITLYLHYLMIRVAITSFSFLPIVFLIVYDLFLYSCIKAVFGKNKNINKAIQRNKRDKKIEKEYGVIDYHDKDK